MKLLNQDLFAYIAGKLTQNTQEERSISDIRKTYDVWALNTGRENPSIDDINREVSVLFSKFKELFGLKSHRDQFISIKCYFVDFQYSSTYDKVTARFFRKSPNNIPFEKKLSGNEDIIMSLPEFILYFANPEGVYILEELTFKSI